MKEGLRACRKCLLYSETREEFFRKLDAYIDHLSEDDRVSQELYEARLALCARCPHLTGGMCALCGCFVELRAALKIRRCPDVIRKW